MIPLYRVAADLQQVCEEHRWSFGFIGGIALRRWGKPRNANDANSTLFTALPFVERSVEPSSFWRAADGCHSRTGCAEDLIVHKAFASRDGDWSDVDSIVQRQGGKLNRKMIAEKLEPLVALKEQPKILDGCAR